MKPLDNQLKNLLRRKDPPKGFAERVMARLETEPMRATIDRRVSLLFWRPVLRWAAVAAVCVVAALAVVRYEHQQRVQAKAERASREAIVALRITNEEIDAALERAQHVTLQALQVPRNSKLQME